MSSLKYPWIIVKLVFQEFSGTQIEEILNIEEVEGFNTNYYMVYMFEKGTFVTKHNMHYLVSFGRVCK